MAKTPKTPAATEAEKSFNVLFTENLETFHQWYKDQGENGRELGHNVILELCMGHVSTAARFALEGKKWAPA